MSEVTSASIKIYDVLKRLQSSCRSSIRSPLVGYLFASTYFSQCLVTQVGVTFVCSTNCLVMLDKSSISECVAESL